MNIRKNQEDELVSVGPVNCLPTAEVRTGAFRGNGPKDFILLKLLVCLLDSRSVKRLDLDDGSLVRIAHPELHLRA